MARRKLETDREAKRSAIVDLVMLGAVFTFQHQPLKPYRVFRTEADKRRFKKHFDRLVGHGCNPKALVTALQMANTIEIGAPPSSKQVKIIRKRILEMADELEKLDAELLLPGWRRIEDSVGLLTQVDRQACHIESKLKAKGEGAEQSDDKLGNLAGRLRKLAYDIHKHESSGFLCVPNGRVVASTEVPQGVPLKDRLRLCAEDYEEWLAMASKKAVPRSHSVLRLNRMCLVLYVKWATRGRPLYEDVAQLLKFFKAYTHPSQLAREAKDFEEKYPHTTNLIGYYLARVHCGTKTYRVPPVKPHHKGDLPDA